MYDIKMIKPNDSISLTSYEDIKFMQINFEGSFVARFGVDSNVLVQGNKIFIYDFDLAMIESNALIYYDGIFDIYQIKAITSDIKLQNIPISTENDIIMNSKQEMSEDTTKKIKAYDNVPHNSNASIYRQNIIRYNYKGNRRQWIDGRKSPLSLQLKEKKIMEKLNEKRGGDGNI